MAAEQLAGRGQRAPADPDIGYWAESPDEPIRLARFECCDSYVCRCDGEDREGAWVAR